MPALHRLPLPRMILAALPRLQSIPRVRRLLARTVVVLGYHDLRRAADWDSWLRVDVDRFRQHLRLLSSAGSFIEPQQLQNLEDLPGSGPRFLITFDDGYPNWLRLGVPVLEELSVPALFFVSTDNLLSRQPYWFDRVVQAVQASRTTRLDLRRHGLEEFRFRTGRPSRRWDDIERLLAAIKRLGDPGSPEVEGVLDELSHLGEEAVDGNVRHRPLSVRELSEMARRGCCHFGSHGHRHEILTRLPATDLQRSLTESRFHLESLTKRAISDLAYPNGDCSDQVLSAAQEAGYERAFVTKAGTYSNVGDRFRIPRLLVGGYDSRARLADRLGMLIFRQITMGHS